MKLIFTSPFYPLWSEGVLQMASLLNARVVHVGDLLRSEIKSTSELGKEIKTALDSGEPLRPDIISELVLLRFFDDSSNRILINYPSNIAQAESLFKYIKNSRYSLDACVVVSASRKSITEKFESQFHCTDSAHPKLETAIANPICEVCGEKMTRTYDLKNYKVSHLIDAYFHEGGVLSGVSTLSRLLGIETVSYTTPQEVANKIQSMGR